jgi:hypothetical protein
MNKLENFMPVLTVPLGLIMLVAAWPKIVLPYEFLSDLYAYQLAGRELGVLAAMILPWMELCVGLCLLLNIFRSGALLAAVALASSFVVAQGWVLYHGLQISCGCFGGASEMVGWFSFLRTCLLFLFIAFLLFAETRQFSKETS